MRIEKEYIPDIIQRILHYSSTADWHGTVITSTNPKDNVIANMHTPIARPLYKAHNYIVAAYK